MSTARTTTRPTWTLHASSRAAAGALSRELDLPPLVATLLANRGLTAADAAREHLAPELSRLHDPARLPGMEAALERLLAALAAGETILVHGDYDVDGISGSALLVRMLRHIGARVAWHLPNRFTDGYSFGDHSVARALEVGATLLVSVDNGTSSVKTIAELAALSIDTVVTDHHEPTPGELPAATAIVNPKLAESDYPFRDLCGAAVAFKLAWGLAQAVSEGERTRADLRELLVDLMGYVAIATICDVVPLVDENRILARFGLKALEATRQPGLVALLQTCNLAGRALRGEDLGFQVGPRINAAGRLGSAERAMEVLLADDPDHAHSLARELDGLNLERKRIERELFDQALVEAQRFADPERYPVTVVAGQGWHQGVVGIVAARLVEALGRPAIVIGLDGKSGRGSARSLPGLSILELMHAGAGEMTRYGGHAQAAGCELDADAVDGLREAVGERARQLAPEGTAAPPLEIDAELPLASMTEELMAQIDRLEPFGECNGRPILVSYDTRLAEPPRVIGADGSHLLLRLRSGDHTLKTLGFGMAERAGELAMGAPLHAVYTPRWNTFRGQTSLELVLEDFRVGPRPSVS